MPRWLRVLLLTVAAVVIVGALAVFAMMAFVFSIGTRMVTVKVETLVRDAATRAPVAGCLLAFEKNPSGGWGRTDQRSGDDGRSGHETSHSSVGSVFLPAREQAVKLRFFLGPPPRYGTYEETEVWDVTLSFRDPRPGGEVKPRVALQRGLAHEEVLQPPPGKAWQQAGTKGLPPPPDGALEVPAVRLERVGGRDVYRIPLAVTLDEAQVTACRRPQE